MLSWTNNQFPFGFGQPSSQPPRVQGGTLFANVSRTGNQNRWPSPKSMRLSKSLDNSCGSIFLPELYQQYCHTSGLRRPRLPFLSQSFSGHTVPLFSSCTPVQCIRDCHSQICILELTLKAPSRLIPSEISITKSFSSRPASWTASSVLRPRYGLILAQNASGASTPTTFFSSFSLHWPRSTPVEIVTPDPLVGIYLLMD